MYPVSLGGEEHDDFEELASRRKIDKNKFDPLELRLLVVDA